MNHLVIAARNLDAPWTYCAGPEDVVDVQGEELTRPIYWRGRQWAYTAYGVECRDGTYAIEHARLWE